VKYTYETLLNPASKGGLNARYLANVVGAGEVKAGTTTELKGVTVVDDHTLEVRFTKPEVLFPIYPIYIMDAGIVAEHKALGDVKEEVLRLAEEQLEVGKRKVESGKTRVRRYVTAREVEEKVNLTEVHAEVLRKVVNQPVADDWDWSDSTIEVIETREEAVVSKTAHVAEEIRLRTEETEHTETIKETVRKQHAEVEHLDEDGKVISK
jgi:stress response protein YsnF